MIKIIFHSPNTRFYQGLMTETKTLDKDSAISILNTWIKVYKRACLYATFEYDDGKIEYYQPNEDYTCAIQNNNFTLIN